MHPEDTSSGENKSSTFDLPPRNYQPVIPQQDDAIEVVGIGRAAKEQKNRDIEMKARDFGIQLSRLFSIDSSISMVVSQAIKDHISKNGQAIFNELSDKKFNLQKLSVRIKELLREVKEKFNIDLVSSEDELSDKIYHVFHLIWAKPIEPYITNYLLRRNSMKTMDLLRVWKDSSRDYGNQTNLYDRFKEDPQTGEQLLQWTHGKNSSLNESLAVEQLKYYALEANKMAALFAHNGEENYLNTEVLQTNDIRELQKILLEENGFSHESWERKHHAYVKISLIYAYLMVEGKLNRKKIEQNRITLSNRIKSICFKYGIDPETKEQVYILNPKINQDGTFEESEDSVLISGFHINTKHDFSLLLKFIMKVLSDSIAPSIDNIRDLIRGRIILLKNPRKSHSSYEFYTQKEAEIAAATKILAILMGIIGTSVDKRNIRLSIEDATDINGNSTGKRLHRSLQLKLFKMFDKDEEGNVTIAGETHPIELQIICYVPPEEHNAEIAEYIEKKTRAAEMQLGVVTYKEYFHDLCEVFIHQYGFPYHDSSAQRKLRELAFGKKSRQKQLMQEIISTKIIEGILSDTPLTQTDIKEMLSDPVSRKILEDALDKIGSAMYPWSFYHLQSDVSDFIDSCLSVLGYNCVYISVFKNILDSMKEGQQSPAIFSEILRKLKEIKMNFASFATEVINNNDYKIFKLEAHLDQLIYIFETGPDQILDRYKLAKNRVRKLCSEIDAKSAKCQTCTTPEI